MKSLRFITPFVVAAVAIPTGATALARGNPSRLSSPEAAKATEDVGALGQSALTAPTKFIEAGGRKIAYRSVGKGDPIVLCK